MKAVRQARLELSGGSTPNQLKPQPPLDISPSLQPPPPPPPPGRPSLQAAPKDTHNCSLLFFVLRAASRDRVNCPPIAINRRGMVSIGDGMLSMGHGAVMKGNGVVFTHHIGETVAPYQGNGIHWKWDCDHQKWDFVDWKWDCVHWK